MRLVLGALFVKQLGIGFPVEPASIERAICVSNEPVFRAGPPRASSVSRTCWALKRAVRLMAAG